MLGTLIETGSSTEAPADDRPLYGRDDELAHLDALLDAARAGHSGALVLSGPAGSGKSALLAAARRRADDMRVLATGGIESEAELPYAALHALVRPLLDRLATLPKVQASALRAALGLGPAPGEHRFVACVAVLSLLADAAQHRPVLCLVDDAHWLDAASAEALAFAARRLEADHIAFVFAARRGDGGAFDAAGLDELALRGLPPAAAGDLLDDVAGEPLAPAVRAWLLDTSDGNPLALVELAAALTPAQRRGAEPLLAPPPVSARVERAFLERVERLPAGTQSLLLVAAADDTGDLATVLATAGHFGVAADALDPAEDADLVRVRDGRIALRHPLLRSAIYHGAPASRRREAHAALADALPGEGDADRRAWHRAAAALDADDGVVDELEDAAARARRRGGHAAAALALERAAALTPDDERRARQLAAGGNDAWVAGRAARALTLLERARTTSVDPLLHADVDRLRALIGLTGGTPADAADLARRAAIAAQPFDSGRALRLLSIATLGATYASDGAGIVAIGEAARRIPAGAGPATRLLSEHLSGVGAYYDGDFDTAAPHLRAALALAEEADDEDDAQSADILTIAASVGLFLGDDRAVHDLHRRMVTRARDRGALGTLTWALPRLAVSDIWAGQWSAAIAGLTEALDLARAQGFDVVVSYLLSELAIVAALRGDEGECRARAAESLALAAAHGARYVAYLANSALVTLELALGRSQDAFDRARAFPVMPGLDFWDALDRIEATVRAGAPELAAPAIDSFFRWAEASGSAWARPVARHCRALVCDDPAEAERLFGEALELHAAASRPFERARTELAFGELLRRARRRRDARGHVRAALEVFEALGARLWAERARSELRASGESARRRDPSTLDDLTAQERQIAHRVAEGHTNRDIAAQLFLSPRTIDFHLRNVFRKLEISSRIELARLDLDALR